MNLIPPPVAFMVIVVMFLCYGWGAYSMGYKEGRKDGRKGRGL